MASEKRMLKVMNGESTSKVRMINRRKLPTSTLHRVVGIVDQLARELMSLKCDLLREAESGIESNIETGGHIDFYKEVEAFERQLIERALRVTSGHQSQAARLLGLKISTLNHKIHSYNIKL